MFFQWIMKLLSDLQAEFALKDLGGLHYLGIEVTKSDFLAPSATGPAYPLSTGVDFLAQWQRKHKSDG